MRPREDDVETGAETARRFALDGPPEGGRVRLAPGEAEHAQRVLRMRAGERALGLDGAGGAWPLVVAKSERGAFEVELDGPVVREPAPGEPRASLPWIEVAVAWPRGERAEQMVERLTQLGVAAVRPLLAERATPQARGAERRGGRLARIVREACKQCGRAWDLAIEEPAELAALIDLGAGGAIALDPRAREALPAVLAQLRARRGSRAFDRGAPLRLFVGPEGGFTPAEDAAFAAANVARARLAPHVLRVETAAEAAAAVIVAAW